MQVCKRATILAKMATLEILALLAFSAANGLGCAWLLIEILMPRNHSCQSSYIGSSEHAQELTDLLYKASFESQWKTGLGFRLGVRK